MPSCGAEKVHSDVSDYYGKVLKDASDLNTNACSRVVPLASYLKAAIGNVHDEVAKKYYGCGINIPDCLENLRVLDLGSGAGRDVYTIAQLVGEQGSVVGLDMTEELLQIAREYQEWHREKFGYAKGNVEFVQGYIEKLGEVGIEDNSIDVIISNCVINLCPDKESVLREVYRVLKPGGEMYFSDMYASCRVPQALVEDPVLLGEGMSGALYWKDFIALAKKVGFADPRLMKDSVITVENKELQDRVKGIQYASVTYRLIKLLPTELADGQEDFGQAATYKGTLSTCPDAFTLDESNVFPKGKAVPVSSNTFKMLQMTRFAPHFDLPGDQSHCKGAFPTIPRIYPNFT